MYLTLKFIHLAAVTMFLGNITLAMVWLRDANRSRDPAIIAHTLQSVIAGDRWITLPSAAVLLVTGIAMATNAGYPLLRTPWLWQSLLGFSVSGLLYAFPIDPLQRRMCRVALAAAPGEMDWVRYLRLSRAWYALGFVSVAIILGIIAMMVFKPA